MNDELHADLDVGETISRARKAQSQWAQRSVGTRLRILPELRFALADEVDEIVPEIKAIRAVSDAEILSTEILPFFAACQFLEKHAQRILATRRLSAGGRPKWLGPARSRVERSPWGVVLILAPANYPFFLAATQAIQALVAGNAVLLKPAPNCSGPANFLAALCQRAGFPSALLQILPENVQMAESAIDAGVDKIHLTGGGETGRQVLTRAASPLTPATMELSGMDAMIVRADADPKRVAQALSYGLSVNKGETCIAPRRVYVHCDAYPKLLELLAESLKARAFQEGLPEMLHAAIDNALQAGAKTVFGQLDSENPQLPILLHEVPLDSPLWLSEHFAAVSAMKVVESDEQALEHLAESGFALGVSIFSEDVDAANRLQRAIVAGVITINDVIVPTADPRLPFGGRQSSGFGVTRGEEGLLDLTTPRVVIERTSKSWAPHFELEHPTDSQLFLGFVRIGHSRRLSERIRGLIATAKLIIQRGP
ncbi:MAG: aldehyde dehydrogenase family protein [Verrucomicrobiota bacterium]